MEITHGTPLQPGRRLLRAAALLAGLLHAGSAALANEAPCPRIVSQSPYITHTLQWLGLEHCIVGVSRYDRLERPRTGGVMDPDGEAIAALAPELLLTSGWTDANRWQAAAPPGARALRLPGFGAMGEIETNLQRIGEAAGLADAGARAEAFAKAWRAAAAEVGGQGRALVVSACEAAPYSFGPNSYIYDLFATAGFDMVETHERIRHLKTGEPYPDLDTLINALSPDWLFVLARADVPQCAMLQARTDVTVIGLDGAPFFHPAPILLEGLRQLAGQRGRWQARPPR